MVKGALKYLLVLLWDKPNQGTSKSVCPGGDWTTHLATHCIEISWHCSVRSWRDDSVMGSVKRLSGVSGFGPTTVPIAFLRGKLSTVISAHSDRGPWSHKGLAVLCLSSPWPHHICWRAEANFRCLIMVTPWQRMHLQTTGVYVLSQWGAFLYSQGNISGLGSIADIHYVARLK